MESIKDIKETLSDNKHLLFYKIMKYPIPKNIEYFFLEKKINNTKNKIEKSEFSRDKKNKFMDEYVQYINSFGKLFKSIPFIKEIYLCNSISFNALKENSDIDLFIITKKNTIRRARFFSLLFFSVLGLKRGRLKKIRKKFCLSFYVTENNQNLYNISLPRSDVYLNYWLAHLITIYQEVENDGSIYKNNSRFKVLMPNHPQKNCLNIGTEIFYGKNKTKNIIEKIFGGIFGQLIEYIIKTIRVPILAKKAKRLGKIGTNIIINDNMLKFHTDKRNKIQLLYNLESKR